MKHLLTLGILCLFSTALLGQTQIYQLDFESSGGYTTHEGEFINGSQDYFTRTDGSSIGATFTNIQGSYYFAGQDIDDGVSLPTYLNIDNIDISGYTNLELRVYLAEDDDGSNEDWDAADHVHINYDIDNSGSYSNGIWIENDGSTYNSAPFLDTDFDGVGDGSEITDEFQQYTSSISGTGSNMDIEIEFDLNSGDEDIAIDNIEIWGTPPCTPSTPSTQASSVAFPNTGETTMDVSWTNGDGDGRIVKINASNSFTDPTNGNDPSANGTWQNSGEQVIYNGSGSSVTVDGLSASTQYWFRVYEYNCSGSNITYQTSTATDNPNSETSLAPQTEVQFTSSAASVGEGSGTYNLELSISDPDGSNATTCEVAITGGNGSAADVDNYTTQTVNFPAGSSANETVTLTITDDALTEGDENLIFSIQNVSGGNNASAGVPSDFDLTIVDNDIPELVISQYIETSSGTTPKGIEIWNLSGSTIDFSTQNLNVEKYTNGSSSSTNEANITTGTLAHGEVMVIGGSDLQTHMNNNYPSVLFVNDPFSFNGDDALELVLNGTTTDVFGTIGSDPGSSWDGNGVSTENQNIDLKLGNTTGDTDGWTDPSERFETITTNDDMTGFGEAPFSVYDGTWSNGAPGSATGSDDFQVKSGALSESSDMDMNSLWVNSGASYTQSSASLTLNGDLTNNGTVTIADGASLLTTDASANLDVINVQRTGTQYNNIFNYWSTPVDGATYNDVWDFGTANNEYNQNDLYTYDRLNQQFTNVTNAFQNMPIGEGIAMTGLIGGGPNTLTFTGTPNNGDINVTVINNPGEEEYALLGNPYPSAIDADLFIDDNTGQGGSGSADVISGTLWFWDVDITKDTFVSDDYVTYTKAGGTNNNPHGPNFNGFIAACQSFMVESTTTGNALFRNSQRVAGNNNQFYKQGPIQRVWMVASSPGTSSNGILIAFSREATDQHDQGWDGKKLKGNPNIAFYSKLNGEDYAIQALSPLTDDKSIPLGLDANVAGTYTISIDSIDGISEEVDILLEDKSTGNFYDLRDNDYTLSVEEAQTIDHLVLHFRSNPTGTPSEADPTLANIWQSGGHLLVKDLDNEDLEHIRVVDLSGRTVAQVDHPSRSLTAISSHSWPAGIYLVEVRSGQHLQTEKIFIQQ